METPLRGLHWMCMDRQGRSGYKSQCSLGKKNQSPTSITDGQVSQLHRFLPRFCLVCHRIPYLCLFGGTFARGARESSSNLAGPWACKSSSSSYFQWNQTCQWCSPPMEASHRRRHTRAMSWIKCTCFTWSAYFVKCVDQADDGFLTHSIFHVMGLLPQHKLFLLFKKVRW